MAVVSFTVDPSLSLTTGPGRYPFPAGITVSALDEVKFFGLLLEISRMFASGKGVITTSGDTVSLTVTIDGTSD